MDFDLEELVNVEQTFYDEGYRDGHAHGRVHGLIEGRALGREKGFEMWEELGFYEGFARLWGAVLAARGAQDERAQNHVRLLLALIAQFPRVNPSTAIASAAADADASTDAGPDVDIPRLFRQIRSRYKLLCATLGVRPTLRAADGSSASPERGDDGEPPHAQSEPTTATSPTTRPKARKNVWAVHDARAGPSAADARADALSF
ncbi:uncharacterized protein BXZ73DRAFT_88781 [Epithele typhae]|uniref:uncharacterized protein n=1 Tax=Epithele typhae TaxID=378194 RepID=UPI002007B426|nr:uncharacterized protein BXZ73DRAFT_88781 [Epithele typhae]KAH9940019.1 hypothetical protein BXZ73DRAFT_88781 [Epithele typhae]